MVQLARFLFTSFSFASWTDQQTWTLRNSRYVMFGAGVVPSFLALACSLALLSVFFSLPLPCAAGIVSGPVGRRVGIWGEVYPGAPPRAEDEHGGRLSGVRRALSGRFPPPPPRLLLLLPATAILSSPRQLQQHFGYQTRRRVPVNLARETEAAGGTVPARCRLVAQQSCPSCAATLPPLPAPSCLSPGPTRGQPLSAQKFSVQRRRQRRLVIIPALHETPFSREH